MCIHDEFTKATVLSLKRATGHLLSEDPVTRTVGCNSFEKNLEFINGIRFPLESAYSVIDALVKARKTLEKGGVTGLILGKIQNAIDHLERRVKPNDSKHRELEIPPAL